MSSDDVAELAETSAVSQQPAVAYGCPRAYYRVLLFISALATACVSLAALLLPLFAYLSPHSHQSHWSTSGTLQVPLDAELQQLQHSQPTTFSPRLLDQTQHAELAALYSPTLLSSAPPPLLPDVSSLSSNSPAVRSLLACLDASITSTPSLRRLVVISSPQSAASAVSLSLALRRSYWCVLVVGSAEDAAFAATTQSALDSFARLSASLLDLQLAESGSVEEVARLTQRLVYCSVAELFRLPYASAARRLGQQSPLLQAKTIAYTLAIHAGVDVLYDTEDGAPVLTSSDLPVMYTSHRYGTFDIRHRTLINHTLPIAYNAERITRRTSNHSNIRPITTHNTSITSKEYNVSVALMNPYPSLGHSDVWPRGFPTSQAWRSLGHLDLRASPPDDWQQFQHCLPAIQQLVPALQSAVDLDRYGEWMIASVREQQQQQHYKPNTTAHAQTRVMRLALSFHSYAPFSAQSTVWLSPAFSSLLLPLTVHARVSDIWRSYIAETLLSYGRVNNRPYNRSQHLDSKSADDSRGPDGVSLLALDIEPCVVYSRVDTLPGTRSASPSRTVDPNERPFTDDAERLIAFLTTRQHGRPFDLLTRARQRISPQRYGEVTQLHLLAELYADLYEAGVLQWDDVQAAIAWATDILRIAVVREQHNEQQPRQMDAFGQAPFLPPQPPHFLPTLPHRQRAIAVCVNFNWPPGDNTLWQLLRYYSLMHDQLAIVAPVPLESLSSHQQYWLTQLFPQVQWLTAAQEDEGRCQQYSLMSCLDWANSTGALDAADVHGVLYTADDLWFDFYEVLYPPPPQPGALPSFTNLSLFHTHLTYPLDEFWYPLPVMEFNMSWPADTISDWEWLNRGVYFAWLKLVWQQWPQHWRNLLTSITAVPDSVVTNSVADMVYVPTSRGQLEALRHVLHYTLLEVPQPPGCVFSEVLFTQLIHLAMMLSGVQPAVPLPTAGPNYDRQYETMYFHPAAPSPNRTTIYAQLHRYLTSPPTRPGLTPLPPANLARVRPVPLRIDGYRWNRDDTGWMRLHLIEGDGDPVFLHPVKLGGGAGGAVHEGYVAGTERMMRRMDEARRAGGRK